MTNRSFCAIVLTFTLLFSNQALGVSTAKKIKYGFATIAGIVIAMKFLYEAWNRLGFFELKRDVKDLKQDTGVLKKGVKEVKDNIKKVDENLQDFRDETDKNFNTVRGDISATKIELLQKISDAKKSLGVLIKLSENNVRQDVGDLKELVETVRAKLVAEIKGLEIKQKMFFKSELREIKEVIVQKDETTGDLVTQVNKIGSEMSKIRKALTDLQNVKLAGSAQ